MNTSKYNMNSSSVAVKPLSCETSELSDSESSFSSSSSSLSSSWPSINPIPLSPPLLLSPKKKSKDTEDTSPVSDHSHQMKNVGCSLARTGYPPDYQFPSSTSESNSRGFIVYGGGGRVSHFGASTNRKRKRSKAVRELSSRCMVRDEDQPHSLMAFVNRLEKERKEKEADETKEMVEAKKPKVVTETEEIVQVNQKLNRMSEGKRKVQRKNPNLDRRKEQKHKITVKPAKTLLEATPKIIKSTKRVMTTKLPKIVDTSNKEKIARTAKAQPTQEVSSRNTKNTIPQQNEKYYNCQTNNYYERPKWLERYMHLDFTSTYKGKIVRRRSRNDPPVPKSK